MSDFITRFIPKDPNFQPIPEIVKKIEGLDYWGKLSSHPSVTVELQSEVSFFDCGQNFNSVSCNVCKKEIPIPTWQESMSKAYEKSKFEDLKIVTPCCNSKTNLNDLRYDFDSGFAKFSVQLLNAGLSEVETQEILLLLKNLTGQRFKKVVSHI